MLDILLYWNKWGTARLESGFQRAITEQLQHFIDTKDIVALIGPRRAGKSTILFQVMALLEARDINPKAMLHMNLEDPLISTELSIKTLDTLYQTYRENIYPVGRAYLFLDEIQNVPGWERWVRARNEQEDIKILVTSSSSQLMSRELGTVLTGRHISFYVYPLSFKEMISFKKINIPEKPWGIKIPVRIKHALIEYLRWGGFPEIVLADNEFRKEKILQQYFDDILFKDVALRHNIRDLNTLRQIAVFLLTQTASLISYKRLANLFNVSADLAQNYCQFLQEAFLVDFLPFYSLKTAERNRNPQKVYAIDLGLRRIVSRPHSEDQGRLIESMIFNCLIQKNRYDTFYWKDSGEIDFLLREGMQVTQLIQVVSENLDQTEVFNREVKALLEAEQIYKKAQKLLIGADAEVSTKLLNQHKINFIPLWHYLLQ